MWDNEKTSADAEEEIEDKRLGMRMDHVFRVSSLIFCDVSDARLTK
jgi:hypothetical protein